MKGQREHGMDEQRGGGLRDGGIVGRGRRGRQT